MTKTIIPMTRDYIKHAASLRMSLIEYAINASLRDGVDALLESDDE